MDKNKKVFFVNEGEVLFILKEMLHRKLTDKEKEDARKYFELKNGFSKISRENLKESAGVFIEHLLSNEKQDKGVGFTIDEEYINNEVEIYYENEGIERKMLSDDEKEEVYYRLMDKLLFIVQDSIQETIDDVELLERNNGAEKHFPHLEVYRRNKNSHQDNWLKVGFFKTEEDVDQFLRGHYNSPYDECAVFKVEENRDRELVSLRGQDYIEDDEF
jgi:hypothetical protein